MPRGLLSPPFLLFLSCFSHGAQLQLKFLCAQRHPKEIPPRQGPPAVLTPRHRVCGQRQFQNSRCLCALPDPGQGLVLLLFPRAADRAGLQTGQGCGQGRTADRAGLASLAPGWLFLSDTGMRLGLPWWLPKDPPKAKWTPALRRSRLEAF